MGSEERDRHLLAQDLAARDLPSLKLTGNSLQRLCNGLVVEANGENLGARVRLYDAGGKFWGVAEIDENGSLVPLRLIAHTSSDTQKLTGPPTIAIT